MNRIIHVSELPAFPDAIYVGRRNNRKRLQESLFSNPFRAYGANNFSSGTTRAAAVQSYRDFLTKPNGDGRYLLARLPDLRDKPLACWCRRSGEEKTPENACHADVLAELLDRYTDDELRAMATS